MDKPYTVAARVTLEKDDLAFPGEAFFAAKAFSASFPYGNIYVHDTRCGREFVYRNGETVSACVKEAA